MAGKRRGKARSVVAKDLPADALRVLLTIHSSSSSSLSAEVIQGCPATMVLAAAETQQQQQQQPQQLDGEDLQQCRGPEVCHIDLQMASWPQLPALITWFSGSVLLADSSAKISFDASLPKDCRGDVHTLVSKKFKQCCESVSEGFGDDRYVAVIAQGVRGRARRVPQEQADHALALWLLHREQLRQQNTHQQLQQQQQQQQQQQGEGDLQQQDNTPTAAEVLPASIQSQHHHHHHQQICGDQFHKEDSADMLPSLGASATLLGALQLAESDEDVSSGSAGVTFAVVEQPREYSRDEVAQMLLQDKLPADLAALWHGPAGQAQRWSRELCLAAAAGELEEVEALLELKPGMVAQSVRDLSSGGQLPLHLAAAAGAVDVVQLLLAAGADVAAQNGYGDTALQVAQRCEQCDCEAILQQAGAVSTQVDSWQGFDGKL